MSLEIPRYAFYPSSRVFCSERCTATMFQENHDDLTNGEGGGDSPLEQLRPRTCFSHLSSQQPSGPSTMILAHKGGSYGSERAANLPKATQLVRSWAGFVPLESLAASQCQAAQGEGSFEHDLDLGGSRTWGLTVCGRGTA